MKGYGLDVPDYDPGNPDVDAVEATDVLLPVAEYNAMQRVVEAARFVELALSEGRTTDLLQRIVACKGDSYLYPQLALALRDALTAYDAAGKE